MIYVPGNDCAKAQFCAPTDRWMKLELSRPLMFLDLVNDSHETIPVGRPPEGACLAERGPLRADRA